MLEHITDFTAWPILTGIFIGYIANRIMSGEGKGCCMNLFVGVVGSYAGTFISHLLNIELFSPTSYSACWAPWWCYGFGGNCLGRPSR